MTSANCLLRQDVLAVGNPPKVQADIAKFAMASMPVFVLGFFCFLGFFGSSPALSVVAGLAVGCFGCKNLHLLPRLHLPSFSNSHFGG